MLDILFSGLADLLNFFFVISGKSYIGAIILFTLAVMLLLFPLTAKQTRSMVEMQRIQPELKKLQAKFKDDRAAQQEAMMALYKEHGVNPLAGCLPLLIQAPVLLLLFNLLRGLTRTREIDGRKVFDPDHLDKTSALYKALEGDTQMVEKGIDLARSAADVFSKSGVVDALPYLLLVAATVATGVYQQRQMTRRNPPSNVTDNPQAAAMQRVTKIMPWMFGIFSWSFQAALVIYFIVSNLFRIGQQSFLYRFDPVLREHSEQKRAAAAKSQPKAKPKPESPGGSRPKAKPKPSTGSGNGKSLDQPRPQTPRPAQNRSKKKRKGR